MRLVLFMLTLPLASCQLVTNCRELLFYYQDSGLEVKDCAEQRYNLFWTIDNRLNWTDARTACKKVPYADLASVHNFEQKSTISALAADTSNLTAWPQLGAYIGLRRALDDCSSGFSWSDGSDLNYETWHSGEPNCKSGDEACVQVVYWYWNRESPAGSRIGPIAIGWNDISCTIALKSICSVPICPMGRDPVLTAQGGIVLPRADSPGATTQSNTANQKEVTAGAPVELSGGIVGQQLLPLPLLP